MVCAWTKIIKLIKEHCEHNNIKWLADYLENLVCEKHKFIESEKIAYDETPLSMTAI